MRKIAYSTLGCPDWNWKQLIERGTEYGYDGVEIRLIERETNLLIRPEFQASQLANRRADLADAGFQVCGLASSVRFDFPDESEWRRQIDVGKAYVDLAAELGARFVRVFGDVLPENADEKTRQAAIANIAEGLQLLGEYAESIGPDVIIETHGDYADSRLVRETLARVESPAVGVLWDTHHPWKFCGETVEATFANLQPWVRHTHWKDSVARSAQDHDEQARQAAELAHSLMSGHQHADYVLFGEGEFPIAECLRLLRDTEYDGWYSLEWEKMWHPELDDPEIALPPFPEKLRELWESAG